MVKSTPSNQPAALQASMHRIAADVTALTESLTASISEVENNQKNSDDSLKSSINAVKCDLEKTNEVVAALRENIAALECSIASSLESVECDRQTAEQIISWPSKHNPAECVRDQRVDLADTGASLKCAGVGANILQDNLNRLIQKYHAPKHRSQIRSYDTQVCSLQDESDEGFCAPLRPRGELAPDTSRPAATPSLQRDQPLGAHVGATFSIRSSPIPQSSSVPVYITEAFNRFIAEREGVVKNLSADHPDAKHVENAKLAEKTPGPDCVDNLATLEARFAELELKVNQTETNRALKAPDRTINTLEARITDLETTFGNFAEKHARNKALEDDVARIKTEGQSTAKTIQAMDRSFEEDIRGLYDGLDVIRVQGHHSAETLGNLDISIEERLKTLRDEVAGLKQKDQSSAEKLEALESRVAESESRTKMACAKPLRVLSGNHITEDGMSITGESVHFLDAAATFIACYDREKTQLLVQPRQYYEVTIEIPLHTYRSTRGPDYQLDLCHRGDVKIIRCGPLMTVSMNTRDTGNSQCHLQLDTSGHRVPLLSPESDTSKSNRWLNEVSQRVMISALMTTNHIGTPSPPPVFRVGQVDVTNSRGFDPANISPTVVVEHEESDPGDSEAPAANVEVGVELNSNLTYRTNIPPIVVKPHEHFGVEGLDARFKKLSIFDAVASHLASYNHHDACGLIIAEQKRHVTVKFDLTKEKEPNGCDSRRSGGSEHDNGSLKLVRRADMLTIERYKTTRRDENADAWFTCRYRLNSLGEWNLSEWMVNLTIGHHRERQWRSPGNENPQKEQCRKAIKRVVKGLVGMMGATNYGEAPTPIILVT